jgi:hypothetical protein
MSTAVIHEQELGKSSQRPLKNRRWLESGVIAALGIAYIITLSGGHGFANDDFAAYVQHAANLVEGRPYGFSNYIQNPGVLWLTPPNGYPPVFPLLLAPVYRISGLNLRALKLVTAFSFVAFLAIFAELIRPMLSTPMTVCALLLLALNPVFWEFRNDLVSEFPYLMFSFGALLLARSAYKNLAASEWRIGKALLLAVLLYCSYGTRAIGIALLPALALADMLKFKRPSRFLLLTLGFTALFIAAQIFLLVSPKDYLQQVQVSPGLLWRNFLFYGKTLSYVWQNAFSKPAQIALAVVFTAMAAASFAKKLWQESPAVAFYLLAYLAILLSWSWEIGLRGLLPVLPIYFAHGLEALDRIGGAWGRASHAACIAALLLISGVTYAADFQCLARLPEPNVQDPAAQQLFVFLRNNTQSSDVLLFPKARALALFTNRKVAALDPGESAEDSRAFVQRIGADVFIEPTWAPPSSQAFAASEKARLRQVFRNDGYEVYRIEPAVPR